MSFLKEYLIEKINSATVETVPVDHMVIEEFLPAEFALKLSSEFPDWGSSDWHVYKNAIEDKKTCNQWNLFKPATYEYFMVISSPEVCNAFSEKFGLEMTADIGLHGGGQHCHSSSGNLNPHLDYSIHPKIGLERRVNAICYLTDDHLSEDGGHFGLWGNETAEAPGKLIKEIAPTFNSAVIFNTSQNSWHGMSKEYNPGAGKLRKSLANYYVSEPRSEAQKHTRALFAPREEQMNDENVKQQIAARVSEKQRQNVYVIDDKEKK